jgi:hypothetical protein
MILVNEAVWYVYLMIVRPDTKTGIIHKFKSSIFHLDKDLVL